MTSGRGCCASRAAIRQPDVIAVGLQPGHRLEHRPARNAVHPTDNDTPGLPGGMRIDRVDDRPEPQRQVQRAEPERRHRLPTSLGVGELACDVPAGIALGDVLAAVVKLLAAGKAELDLGQAALIDVQPERHDRLALRLRPA